MIVGEQLSPGQRRVSNNGQYLLILQTDGNLCLYDTGGVPHWCTNTYGKNTQTAIMQTDGNFVLYDNQGHFLWNTNTPGHGSAYLTVTDDGNVVIYDGSKVVWTTNKAQ
jgi:hypothetical protein